MGLMSGEGKYTILTDIQGLEDHYGDMDFKVAGTRDGITALQMDNKAGGITREILVQALAQARKGRMEILDKMDACIAEPRKELSAHAPKITTMQIDPDKIRDVIGSGGKTIRSIVQRTGAKIDVDDSGRVYIAAVNGESAKMAQKIIDDLQITAQRYFAVPGSNEPQEGGLDVSFNLYGYVLPFPEAARGR